MSRNEISLEKKGEKYQSWLRLHKTTRHIICIFLCILSLFPFWVMIANATRDTVDIQRAFSLIPSNHLGNNFDKLLAKCSKVPIWQYMFNSAVVAFSSTILCVYFSSMIAYGVSVYKFKGRKLAWSFIMAVMMVPSQVSIVGFFRFMFNIGLSNSFIPLIIPAIAAPSTIFFMKQYMQSALPLEIIDAARIDGSGELHTFNRIAIPLMKPAIATQAIFAFITSWNNFFTPSIMLTTQEKFTLPMFIQMLKSEQFRTDYGIIYMGLVITIIPIFIVYFALSKHIIAGVALGGVKE